MKFKKIDSQLVIAIGVLIASFSALFVSVRQAQIMNDQTDILLQQTKAEAWPYLDIGLDLSFQSDTIKFYSLSVKNKGTGPARISGVKIMYNGKPYPSWEEIYKAADIPENLFPSATTSGINNAVISSDEKVLLIKPNNTSFTRWFYSISEKLSIEICYQSVYKEFSLASLGDFSDGSNFSNTEGIEACDFPLSSKFMD